MAAAAAWRVCVGAPSPVVGASGPGWARPWSPPSRPPTSPVRVWPSTSRLPRKTARTGPACARPSSSPTRHPGPRRVHGEPPPVLPGRRPVTPARRRDLDDERASSPVTGPRPVQDRASCPIVVSLCATALLYWPSTARLPRRQPRPSGPPSGPSPSWTRPSLPQSRPRPPWARPSSAISQVFGPRTTDRAPFRELGSPVSVKRQAADSAPPSAQRSRPQGALSVRARSSAPGR